MISSQSVLSSKVHSALARGDIGYIYIYICFTWYFISTNKEIEFFGFILCMFEMELINQIMGSEWEYVGKRAGYVTLNKTNLRPDKVRDPSYCKSG